MRIFFPNFTYIVRLKIMFGTNMYVVSWHGKFLGLLMLKLIKKLAIPMES
jgi:hypothetical protein